MRRTKREDFLCHYSQDLTTKSQLVRDAILNLPKLKIPSLANVTQAEYDLIKLAVINSIKGEMIAYEKKSRENFVERVFLAPAKARRVLNYKNVSGTSKWDFEGDFTSGPRFGIEVKGGEGNSVTILQRPPKADIFVVWSHLDVMSNTPPENMRAVLGRIVKQMINKDEIKQKVDFLVFYDKWYKNGVKVFPKGPALPDVFVLPKEILTKRNPHPPLPKNVEKNSFVKCLMNIVGRKRLAADVVKMHIWNCDIELFRKNKKWMRRMSVFNELDPDVLFTEKATVTSVKL